VSWNGKGGFEFKGPFWTVVARNISSHPTAGIGAWTDAEIKRALTQDAVATAARSSCRWRVKSGTAR
jgi:hypothetical protein